jgi:hypothetical protein
MKLLALFTALVVAGPFAHAQDAKADFPKSGFSISPLDVEPGNSPARMVASFLLPPENGFQSNVNVMLMAGHRSIASFVDVTKKEFAGLSVTIVSDEKPDDHSWIVEYIMKQRDTKMHFYARAVYQDGHVYLATGTARDADWAKAAVKLKACVDSLKTK